MAREFPRGEGALIDWARFEGLTFEAFRQRALDPSLSDSEKIGFPDALRAGSEELILQSISDALGLERTTGLLVVDIGCGCGVLPRRLIELCRERDHRLVLIDSPEMLAQLPDDPIVQKVPGSFPKAEPQLELYRGRADAILVYSVIHHVFAEDDVWSFVDAALALLSPGGGLLFGDVPNVSKRQRFLSSERGEEFHRAFMGTDESPQVDDGVAGPGKIDDAVILELLARVRSSGFDAYVIPQPDDLPLANRREDVLVKRP